MSIAQQLKQMKQQPWSEIVRENFQMRHQITAAITYSFLNSQHNMNEQSSVSHEYGIRV